MKFNFLPERTGCAVRRTPMAALVLLTLLASTSAWAHKVTVFAWVEDQTVYTQSKFSGGRSAQNARIAVYNAAGEKLLEGRTDTQGRFAFTPPKPEALRIVLMAGSGHRGEWKVAAEEFAPTAGTPVKTRTRGTHATAPPEATTPEAGELQAMIEAALDKKLAPFLRRLEEQHQGPALKDIFGGIGYIVGIVGLVAYMQSRRKTG
ncbi:MAG: hypothetical protein PVF97_07245 [Desulfobacterales bacterium]|jgi:nickel transport protein